MTKNLFILKTLALMLAISSSLNAHFAQKAAKILQAHGPQKFQALMKHRFAYHPKQINRFDYEKLSLNKSREGHISDLQNAYHDLTTLSGALESGSHSNSISKIVAARIALGIGSLGATASISPFIDKKLDTPFCFTTAGGLVGFSFLNSAFQGRKEETIARKNCAHEVKQMEEQFITGLADHLKKNHKYNSTTAQLLELRIKGYQLRIVSAQSGLLKLMKRYLKIV